MKNYDKREKAWEEALKTAMDFIPRWVSMSERRPEIMSTVIISGRMKYEFETDFFYFVDVATYIGGEEFETFNDWYEGQDIFAVTHWMPLPPPVKEDWLLTFNNFRATITMLAPARQQ